MSESSADMDRLFVYGTLLCPKIMEQVSGLSLPATPATLSGFQRLPVRDEPYPALIPKRGQTTSGSVYSGITPAAWRRLDDFEGIYYERQLVTVQLVAGESRMAFTYVLRPGYMHLLAAGDWDFDQFLAHGKQQFESAYKGYEVLRNTMGDAACRP